MASCFITFTYPAIYGNTSAMREIYSKLKQRQQNDVIGVSGINSTLYVDL